MNLPTDGSLARIIKSAKSNKYSSEYNTNQTERIWRTTGTKYKTHKGKNTVQYKLNMQTCDRVHLAGQNKYKVKRRTGG